jgi:signal transduction histidine kinase
MVVAGKVEFVGRHGDYASLAAHLALRHLSRLGQTDTATSSPGAAMSDEVAEIFRHDINNPLTGILGNAELVLSHGGKLAPRARPRLVDAGRVVFQHQNEDATVGTKFAAGGGFGGEQRIAGSDVGALHH